MKNQIHLNIYSITEKEQIWGRGPIRAELAIRFPNGCSSLDFRGESVLQIQMLESTAHGWDFNALRMNDEITKGE